MFSKRYNGTQYTAELKELASELIAVSTSSPPHGYVHFQKHFYKLLPKISRSRNGGKSRRKRAKNALRILLALTNDELNTLDVEVCKKLLPQTTLRNPDDTSNSPVYRCILLMKSGFLKIDHPVLTFISEKDQTDYIGFLTNLCNLPIEKKDRKPRRASRTFQIQESQQVTVPMSLLSTKQPIINTCAPSESVQSILAQGIKIPDADSESDCSDEYDYLSFLILWYFNKAKYH